MIYHHFIILSVATVAASSSNSIDYWTERANFIKNEQSRAIGSSIILSPKEKLVNEIIMNFKYAEYDAGLLDPQDFLPSVHFFHAKKRVEESQVYKFIQKVPKGASLHSHDTALVSGEYVYNLTFRENLYACVVNNRLKLHFFSKQFNDECSWELLRDIRQRNSSFDDFVRSELNIIVDDPIKIYPNINVVWARFLQTFTTVVEMITYKPIFQEYFYQALQELHDDNVQYIEFRGTLPEVYELNGTIYSPEEVVEFYIETVELFKMHHPDFQGARFIYAPSRNCNNKTADDYVRIALNLKELYPDFIAGFDLVGEEEKGKPLIDFIPQLLELREKMNFFFHAAETDWNGVSTDYNLVDAILLNSTRIGHGFGITKHPTVLDAVKRKQIAIEINPISNQVLKLVDDLRNHPGSFLIADDYPVVICCDDPSFWGAKALSFDWYMAFMGLSSREGDLRLLKQLARNSLIYSAMESKEKEKVLEKWEEQWEEFLDDTLTWHDYQNKFHYYEYFVEKFK